MNDKFFRGHDIKVSVTVPVYNTSVYLRKCLDSLAAQTLEDIEFILVDDGSTDESGAICDEYAHNDTRFRVIHQSNSGSAIARQTGLDMSNGKFVIVCDSDDWVEPNIYEQLYYKAESEEADIVTCGFYAEYGEGKTVPRQTVFKEKDGLVDNFDFMNRGAGSSWVKLIRRSLFETPESRYEPGINLSEDSLILYKLLRANPKVIQIDGHLYHYRRQFGTESYTNNVKMANIHQLYFTYNWLKSNYAGNEYEPIVFQRAVDLAFACLRVKDLDYAFVNTFLKGELPLRRFVKNTKSLKSCFVLIEKLFPISISKYMLNRLYRLVYS